MNEAENISGVSLKKEEKGERERSFVHERIQVPQLMESLQRDNVSCFLFFRKNKVCNRNQDVWCLSSCFLWYEAHVVSGFLNDLLSFRSLRTLLSLCCSRSASEVCGTPSSLRVISGFPVFLSLSLSQQELFHLSFWPSQCRFPALFNLILVQMNTTAFEKALTSNTNVTFQRYFEFCFSYFLHINAPKYLKDEQFKHWCSPSLCLSVFHYLSQL